MSIIAGAKLQAVWGKAERRRDFWLWVKVAALVSYVISLAFAVFVSYYYVLATFGFVFIWIGAWHKEQAAIRTILGMIDNPETW